MANSLVTGGAGFIGSHLVERLLADGDTVTVLDNLATGSTKNLESVSGHTRLSIHQVSVADPESIQPLFQDIDHVYHLAGLADIVPSIERPEEFHHANVNGTLTVLEAARGAGVKRLVYAASSSCYGLPDMFPTLETAAIRPMYPYALTKYLGERYVMHWNDIYQLPTISLRLFNVYGPRARTSAAYGAVFNVFLAQKLNGKALTVVGDGTQTRDFTFVTDVADAFVRAAESDLSGEIFNVGSGDTYSINHLTSLLGGQVTYIPKRPGEPDCTFADTAKITQALGWKPEVGFEEGVSRMLEAIDQWREAPLWDPKSIESATQEWFAHLGASGSD